MKVKVGGFTSKYAQPGDMLHVSFYKNDSMVGDISASYLENDLQKSFLILLVLI